MLFFRPNRQVKLATSFALGLGVVATVFAAQLRPSLRIHGKLVTDDVIVSNGKLYVPVTVLADSLNLKVRRSSGGCDLIGTRDELGWAQERNGFGLEVIDVVRASQYRPKFGYYDFSAMAGPGNELIVVTCRVTNATGVPQAVDLTNGRNTALSDARFRSYVPLKGSGGRVASNAMISLPADRWAEFALKFEVPRGFRLDRLIVSIQNSAFHEPTDFRVSLSRG